MGVFDFVKGLFSGGTQMEAVKEVDKLADGVFQARLGFYPCAYETYRKLKMLNYYCSLWERADRKHYFWSRKLPHNRVTWVLDTDSPTTKWKAVPKPEPKCCPMLDKDTRYIISKNFQRARMPKADAASVNQLSMTLTEIDKLLASVEKWHAENP